jgi:hypothetical protein
MGIPPPFASIQLSKIDAAHENRETVFPGCGPGRHCSMGERHVHVLQHFPLQDSPADRLLHQNRE